MTRQEWQEEFAYCVGVVRKGGTHEVPRDSIMPYLELQAKSSRREGETDIADKLDAMIMGDRFIRHDGRWVGLGAQESVTA
jgi:hypothetical protein